MDKPSQHIYVYKTLQTPLLRNNFIKQLSYVTFSIDLAYSAIRFFFAIYENEKDMIEFQINVIIDIELKYWSSTYSLSEVGLMSSSSTLKKSSTSSHCDILSSRLIRAFNTIQHSQQNIYSFFIRSNRRSI